YLLTDREGKRFRSLGIAYLITLVLMIFLGAKNYYLAPIYPMLFAAGGVFWENMASRFRLGKPAVFSYVAIATITGLIFLPLAVPILPVEKFIAYQNVIGISTPKTEVGFDSILPQHFADRFGWEEMASKTAEVYYSLPPEERERAAIFGNNYGDAGAIDFFGKKYGLPKAISGHQSYYIWGPGSYDGSVMIILGDEKEDAEEYCMSVEERDLVGHTYAMSYERFHILVCRGLKTPLAELWPKVKHWN
ncbi:MAG: glycosyltransferase, partial [Pyrinomonadaceae bacterium]